MKLFRKRRKTFFFTKKVYLTTLPYMSPFEDGFLITIFDPDVDITKVLNGFRFKLWAFTKRSVIVDYAIVTKSLDNSCTRFTRFYIREDGTAIMEPVPVDKLTDISYMAANQVLYERTDDCKNAGYTELQIRSLPREWINLWSWNKPNL